MISSPDDFFPFRCANPNCSASYERDKFDALTNRRGLIYAECPGQIYLGITCEKCDHTTVKGLQNEQRIIDLRQFIITPNPFVVGNRYEQIQELKKRHDKNDFLHFQFIPAWDSNLVSLEEMEALFKQTWEDMLSYYYCDESVPYMFPSQSEIIDRAASEASTRRVHLRRLYPDTPVFRAFLGCISHYRITAIETYDNVSLPRADGRSTPEEIRQVIEIWRLLLNAIKGVSLKDAIIEHLKNREVQGLTENWVTLFLDLELFMLSTDEAEELRTLSREIGFEKKAREYLKRVSDEIFRQACTQAALLPKRDELLNWVNRKEKGKPLFVHAPMGLGKTYSIAQVLAAKSDLSAVVFMPTLKLCAEFGDILEQHLKATHGAGCDTQKNYYFVYGITNEECGDRFKKLIDIQKKKAGSRYDVCKNECPQKAMCRVWTQYEEAKKARIIITTHCKYDVFYSRPDLHMWQTEVQETSEGEIAKVVQRERDVFIIDEDLVLSNCYQPFSVEHRPFHNFIIRFSEFTQKWPEHEKQRKIALQFYGQVSACNKTTLITPIERNFAFPEDLVKRWNRDFKLDYEFHPERDEDDETVSEDYGNYLGYLQDGISYGAVSEVHGKVRRIFFPNTKVYDLSGLPPHVFFDGTLLDAELLEKRIKGVKIAEPDRIEVKPLWRRRLFQNTNSDLPASKILEDKEKVIRFVSELIAHRGLDHKYFFLTNEALEKAYLKDFLEGERKKGLDYFLAHFKGLRGINEAKDCDICVVLGSYNPPDAVEIASSLELIHKTLPKNQNIKCLGKLWRWAGHGKTRRFYYPEFSSVGKMANIIRRSEQRQGMGRTRYLYHDVDFYVVSKDPVTEYEPFLPESCLQEPKFQFRADIFEPRDKSSLSLEPAVEKATIALLNDNWFVRAQEVTNKLSADKKAEMRRGTVEKHLKKMSAGGDFVQDGRKYLYPLNGRRVLFSSSGSRGLSRQRRFTGSGFPFTVDCCSGCLLGCKYCQVPETTHVDQGRFQSEVRVKTWLPEVLDRELAEYRDLPQHLKRVQINGSCEYYLPKVLKEMKQELNRDLMIEILGVFEKHWLAGNRWMIHILTRSNLIRWHIEALQRLKHMVQVEISFSCLGERMRRKIEKPALTTERRLRTVKRLSEAGIFVRVMAVPFLESKVKCEELRTMALDHGAKAFMHNGLKFFAHDAILKGKIIRKNTKKIPFWRDLIVKSGEPVMEDGQARKVLLLMPGKSGGGGKKKWMERLVEREEPVIDCGYSECNEVDWGYIL